MKKILLLVVITLLFARCNSDEYSPNQIFNRSTATDVNLKQIALLQQKTANATIRIAVSGDTQRNYEESEQFVANVNARNDIDFVFLNGDISDFGLLLEFDGIYKIYSKLNVPFISVIGNHDLVANGKDIYKRMFGPLNFTFNYGGIKFICHDTNGREYNFNGQTPDINWLKANVKLDAETKNIIAIAHISPNDGDFDPKLSTTYQNLFNQTPGMLASIHSHQHSSLKTYYQNGTGIPFFITNAIVKRAYTIIEIKNGQITAQEINF